MRRISGWVSLAGSGCCREAVGAADLVSGFLREVRQWDGGWWGKPMRVPGLKQDLNAAWEERHATGEKPGCAQLLREVSNDMPRSSEVEDRTDWLEWAACSEARKRSSWSSGRGREPGKFVRGMCCVCVKWKAFGLEALSNGWLTRGARKGPHRRLETVNGKENKLVSARLVFGGEPEQDRDSSTVFEVVTEVQERDRRNRRSLSGWFPGAHFFPWRQRKGMHYRDWECESALRPSITHRTGSPV
jgi:hypothetical protein